MRAGIIDAGRVLLEFLVVTVLRRLLKLDDRDRIPEMVLLVIAGSELMEAD